MIIVGIDLAPKNSGFVVMEVDGNRPNILLAKEIRTEKQDIVSVSDFADFVAIIIKTYNPVCWVIEAPTQQKISMVNVDVGFNLGVLSLMLYRYWQSFCLIEPGKLYKWVSTHNKDKQRKNKVRQYAQQFFPGVMNFNITDAIVHSVIGFYFIKYGEQMIRDGKSLFKTTLTGDQIYVLTNKQKTGLFDQQKYFVNLAHVDKSISKGKESEFMFYDWEEKLCGKVMYTGR